MALPAKGGKAKPRADAGPGPARQRPAILKPPEPERPQREPLPEEVYDALPEMPAGKELDVLVARYITGLTRLKVYAYFEGAQSDVYRLHSAQGKTFILPEYSRDVARAWEAIAALSECTFELRVAGGAGCSVQVLYGEGARAAKRIAEAQAESAALAVCRAALAAYAMLPE